MGLFSAFKNIAQGKPVFDPSQEQHDQHQQAPAGGHGMPSPGGSKLLPRVYIEFDARHAHVHGNQAEYYGIIHNDSPVDVMLDKVRMFNSARELDTVLHPHEHHEFLLYKGPLTARATEAHAELQYRGLDGDYFCGLHSLELRQLSNNTYAINRMRYDGLKDI